MKKDFIRLSGMLFIITLVAALLLAGVNAITEDKIRQTEEDANKDAMKVLFPEADDYNVINESVTEWLKNGENIGYCVNVSPKGYGGEIKLLVGIDNENKVAGIEILSHSETPGLGAKSTGDEFKSQFKGKDTDLNVVKTQTENSGEIQAITGATVTSRAIADGVKEASAMIEEIKGEK